MDIYLFSALFILTLILLLLTFFKRQIIVGIFTGIFFLLMGVICWTGISYISSTSIVGTTGNYTVTNHYSDWSNPVVAGFTDNQITGTAFVLFGLFLLLVSGFMVFSGKKSIDFSSDDSGGGGDEAE